MGINIGALISPIFCSYVGEKINWRLGFGLAGLGMLLGLIQYMVGARRLGNAGLHPASTGDRERDRRQKRSAVRTVAAGLAAFALVGTLAATGVVEISATTVSNALGWLLLGISVVVFWWLIGSRTWTVEERKRSAAILVLFIASAVFWAAFEQAGSSLNLFAERATNRWILGWEFPAGWFQFVQPIFVVTLAPVFAWIWMALNRRRREPSDPAKFSWGLLFGGLAFALLIPAAAMVQHGAQVGVWWLTGTYFLQTLGELCLSPVGLSAVTKLAPERAAGFMMGIWFLSISIGNWLAGKAGVALSSMPLATLFGAVAAFAIAAGLLLALVTKPTVRLMAGAK